jgi:hypothetical protein
MDGLMVLRSSAMKPTLGQRSPASQQILIASTSLTAFFSACAVSHINGSAGAVRSG